MKPDHLISNVFQPEEKEAAEAAEAAAEKQASEKEPCRLLISTVQSKMLY